MCWCQSGVGGAEKAMSRRYRWVQGVETAGVGLLRNCRLVRCHCASAVTSLPSAVELHVLNTETSWTSHATARHSKCLQLRWSVMYDGEMGGQRENMKITHLRGQLSRAAAPPRAPTPGPPGPPSRPRAAPWMPTLLPVSSQLFLTTRPVCPAHVRLFQHTPRNVCVAASVFIFTAPGVACMPLDAVMLGVIARCDQTSGEFPSAIAGARAWPEQRLPTKPSDQRP